MGNNVAMSKISYSAVVLDEESATQLNKEFSPRVPTGWKWFGHHMTIKLGELPENLKASIGQEVELLIEKFGVDEKVIAVQVADNGLSSNDIPHITLAVNTNAGGKPMHSNKIPLENWNSVENRFKVKGTIQEIPHR